MALYSNEVNVCVIQKRLLPKIEVKGQIYMLASVNGRQLRGQSIAPAGC